MSSPARARKKKPVYSAHPSLSRVQGMMEKLKERTGKTLDVDNWSASSRGTPGSSTASRSPLTAAT